MLPLRQLVGHQHANRQAGVGIFISNLAGWLVALDMSCRIFFMFLRKMCVIVGYLWQLAAVH
jgi:hypothetical protein